MKKNKSFIVMKQDTNGETVGKKYLTVNEFAKELKRSSSLVYLMMKDGRLPFIKSGHTLLIDQDQVPSALAKIKVSSPRPQQAKPRAETPLANWQLGEIYSQGDKQLAYLVAIHHWLVSATVVLLVQLIVMLWL